MANEKKAFGINLPNLTQHEQEIEEIIARKKDAWKKLLQEKRMPVSFMKMNNSHKRRREQMQKKLENVV